MILAGVYFNATLFQEESTEHSIKSCGVLRAVYQRTTMSPPRVHCGLLGLSQVKDDLVARGGSCPTRRFAKGMPHAYMRLAPLLSTCAYMNMLGQQVEHIHARKPLRCSQCVAIFNRDEQEILERCRRFTRLALLKYL